MCLVQVNPANPNMSVQSACNCHCISDSLVRHADIMSKAELEADMNEMKTKWNRSRVSNNQKRRPWKGDERTFRKREKSGNNDKNRSSKTTSHTTSAENMVTSVDVVDASCLDRIPRIPHVSGSPDPDMVSAKSKKVHFDEEHLVEVTVFPDDEESADMRKCYWEIFARDRGRFKDRINRAEADLKIILMSDHRQRVYNQRFSPLIEA